MRKLNHKFFGIIDIERDVYGSIGDSFGDGISVF